MSTTLEPGSSRWCGGLLRARRRGSGCGCRRCGGFAADAARRRLARRRRQRTRPPTRRPISTSWPTLTLSPVLTLTSFTTPSTFDGHFDRRLVGLELEHGLILLRCASPGFTITRTTSPLVDVLAKFGKFEVSHGVILLECSTGTSCQIGHRVLAGAACAVSRGSDLCTAASYAIAGSLFSGSMPRSLIAFCTTLRVDLPFARQRGQRCRRRCSARPPRRSRAASARSSLRPKPSVPSGSAGRGTQRAIASGSAFM